MQRFKKPQLCGTILICCFI